MRLYRLASYLIIIILLPLLSCEKTIIEQVTGPNGNGKLYSIEGHAQKGPFIVGTDVTVSELNDKLFPTGRVFFSTILDDEGYFELPGVVLESPYIQIKVRGRYFSETGGYVPTEELTLYSLADITKSETINVNILTHLEKERVEYLVQEKDHTFESAKEKAQEEILKVFEWESLSVEGSESLDISEDNTGGAVLLAMSAIFENIEFITRLETIVGFKSDFEEDGTLDSEQIQNRLLTSADLLSREWVRINLETKYEIELPDFEGALETFIENSSFVNYFELMFPKTVDGGKINLMRHSGTSLSISDSYVLFSSPIPTGVEFGNVLNGVGMVAYYPNSPSSSFNANSNQWIDTYSDNYYCTSPNDQAFCNRQFFGSQFSDQQISIPVSFSGNGRLELNFEFDIDGIVKSSSIEFTW